MADPSRNELAESRTELAEDRTILAHERSFAGWLRTGMACVGIALGFHALFARLDPAWVPKAIASAFLVIAIVIFITSARRAHSVLDKLEAHKVRELRAMRLTLLSAVLVAATIALGAAFWWLV